MIINLAGSYIWTLQEWKIQILSRSTVFNELICMQIWMRLKLEVGFKKMQVRDMPDNRRNKYKSLKLMGITTNLKICHLVFKLRIIFSIFRWFFGVFKLHFNPLTPPFEIILQVSYLRWKSRRNLSSNVWLMASFV